MQTIDTVVAVFADHPEAEAAVKNLAAAGFETAKPSHLDVHAGAEPVAG